jgi:hypothetical protein
MKKSESIGTMMKIKFHEIAPPVNFPVIRTMGWAGEGKIVYIFPSDWPKRARD